MCRVCGGQNDTCTKHVGVFHTDLPSADQPGAEGRKGASHSKFIFVIYNRKKVYVHFLFGQNNSNNFTWFS